MSVLMFSGASKLVCLYVWALIRDLYSLIYVCVCVCVYFVYYYFVFPFNLNVFVYPMHVARCLIYCIAAFLFIEFVFVLA